MPSVPARRLSRRCAPILAAVGLFALCACTVAPTEPPADLVIRNARVMTLDPDRPAARAVAVRGERIVAVGDDRDVDALIQDGRTVVIDAEGSLLAPGFNDAHAHFLGGGLALLNLDLRAADTVADVQRLVRERARELPAGQPIIGRGWDHERFPDRQWPDRTSLDEAAPDHPVFLTRVDGHAAWVNSLALARAGVDRATEDPPGGTVVRHPATGEPTGILLETAIGLVRTGEYTGAADPARQAEALERALAEARRLGVTSVQQLNDGFELFERFRREGRLTARVTVSVELTDDPGRLAEYERLRQAYPPSDDWVRFGFLKGFIDGTLGSATALMHEPFLDNPATAGLPQMPRERLEELVLAADRRGFQVGIHAIGDKANQWVLDAYERAQRENGVRDSRHRVEHAQILAEADIPRFAGLGVVASMQPTHCISDKRFAERRIGLERCAGAYAWRRLLDSGARLAFGTDWPVEPLDPAEGVYAAVTRRDRSGEAGDGWFPDQKLSLAETIELYTAGAAWAEFTEDRKGRLKPGWLADLVLFTQDLTTLPEADLLTAQVAVTIVGGRVVYRRPAE